MNAFMNPSDARFRFELRFTSLHQIGRALAFPCDPAGRVDLDGLSERARNNYFLARSSIGRDFAFPIVSSFAGQRAATSRPVPRVAHADGVVLMSDLCRLRRLDRWDDRDTSAKVATDRTGPQSPHPL